MDTQIDRTAAHDAVQSRADWAPLVEDLKEGHGFKPLEIEGRLPAELQGTLFRVGPGLFSRFGRRYGHLFDADGAVSAVRFSNGRADGAVRVIEGPDLLAERRAGRPLQFGFGTPVAGLPRSMKPKNAANTNVLCWNDRLFALYEAGLPTELRCDEDLRTVGETDLDGALRGTFSAHPHYSPRRKAAYNFGLRVLPWGSAVDLYELPDQGPARRLASLPFSGVTVLHDFILTERYAVFFGCPIRLRWQDLLLRRKTIADSLAWRPELGTSVLVVPLDEPSKPIRFETEALMLYHFANAFERGRELVVDFVRYPDFDRPNRLTAELMSAAPSGTDPRSRLFRATLDLDRRRMRCEELWSRTGEFPTLAPGVMTAEHRFVYLAAMPAGPGAGESFPTGLAKLDVASGRVSETALGPGCYVSEAVFAPRAGASSEDDGYLLSLALDARRKASFVAVLDARDVEAGPVAKVWFDQVVPMTFHGAWRPEDSISPNARSPAR